MKNYELIKKVAKWGFSLLDVEEEDPNLILIQIVETKDLRFWEGFPVVLANIGEKGLLDYKKISRYLRNPIDKKYLTLLILISLALYKFFNLKFLWINKLYEFLTEKQKKEVNEFFKKIKDNAELKIANYTLSSERLKTTFNNNYFIKTQNKLPLLLAEKEELSLEYALSCIFSPKQKELFFKKLKGEKFTKTEKEYFSRVVKKKILALANPQLHRLAQKLLE